ncbi:MAG: SH3 domain-containing protein [Myxococcales bacterium]|nr:SH3 domain-containing protein [Myxococcales bacterium]
MLSAIAIPTARADDDERAAYARVIVEQAVIRSGPSVSYQRVYLAERGETFPILGRSSRAYWFRVELPDGTSGWIPGAEVYNHELGEDEADDGRFLPAIFAPPALPTATGELSVTAGLLGRTFGFRGGGGFLAVRPAFYLTPEFGFEGTLGASVAEGGQIYMGTVGGIVNVFPRSPVVPYVVAGGGMALSDPNADSFILASGSTGVLYGGGGLRFGFRYRLVVRIEARAYAFYQTERYVAQEELSGGITVFF